MASCFSVLSPRVSSRSSTRAQRCTCTRHPRRTSGWASSNRWPRGYRWWRGTRPARRSLWALAQVISLSPLSWTTTPAGSRPCSTTRRLTRSQASAPSSGPGASIGSDTWISWSARSWRSHGRTSRWQPRPPRLERCPRPHPGALPCLRHGDPIGRAGPPPVGGRPGLKSPRARLAVLDGLVLTIAVIVFGVATGAFTGGVKGYDGWGHLTKVVLVLRDFPAIDWNYDW